MRRARSLRTSTSCRPTCFGLKLRAPDDLEAELQRNSFVQLPIRVAHAVGAGTLPRLDGDPFDRCSSRRRSSSA